MNARSSLAAVFLGVAAALAGCSSQPSADTPRMEEKTFSLVPAAIPVQVGVLTGQLTDLSIVQRVNAETREVVYAPQLRGTLKLKNTSSDEAVGLVGGRIDFLDASDARLTMPPDRGDTTFRFHSYSGDRLDPGGEATHSVDVPFPAAGLNGKALKEIRLSITYLPAPYRQESVEVPVTVAAR